MAIITIIMTILKPNSYITFHGDHISINQSVILVKIKFGALNQITHNGDHVRCFRYQSVKNIIIGFNKCGNMDFCLEKKN